MRCIQCSLLFIAITADNRRVKRVCGNQFCDNMCNIVLIVLDLVCVIFFSFFLFFGVASLMDSGPFWQPATIVVYCAFLLFCLWLIKFFFCLNTETNQNFGVTTDLIDVRSSNETENQR